MVTRTQPDQVAKVLFGDTRRDILSLLYERPEERFYLREIARLTGAGLGPVQRELKQLVAAGLALKERRGNNVFFQANAQSPVFPDLRSILEKTSGAAGVLRSTLRHFFEAGRIEAAFIYGSVAKGHQRSESDVDLMILGDLSLVEAVPAIRLAENRLHREVNPSLYSTTDFKEKYRTGNAFLRRVVASPRTMIFGGADVIEQLARE